ncbi:MAG: hypothetical protein CHACPFDD_01239 [Phycisphaerae bacterium]|nr:hypothetical protein [Phycisphaerae bacterium]
MSRIATGRSKRATILLMVVGLLSMLFIVVTAYITLARFDRLTLMQSQRANTVESIVGSVTDLIGTVLREQLADSSGRVFSGQPVAQNGWRNFSSEDLPGFGGARMQAALEPYLPATSPRTAKYARWPAVSSLDQAHNGTTPPWNPTGNGVAMYDLVAAQGRDLATPRWLLDPSSSSATQDNADFGILAREPFMDADGDGMPDAFFVLSTAIQELANSFAGDAVKAPRCEDTNNDGTIDTGGGNPFIYAAGPQRTAALEEWKRHDRFSRYDVAVRLVNHGGMITLDSPSEPRKRLQGSGSGGKRAYPSNRRFTAKMFNFINEDGQDMDATDNKFFRQLDAERLAIEPILRRRGGLLASSREKDDVETTRIPTALRVLEDTWPKTFVSTHGRKNNAGDPGAWQRFNISLAEERGDTGNGGWLNAIYLNPNTLKNLDASDPKFRAYDKRHLLTLVNNSDDLARKQAPPPGGGVGGSDIGTYQGQLKFYLGKILDPDRGAFDPVTGQFRDAIVDPGLNGLRGIRLVEELAGFYYDMLSGHEFPAAPAIGSGEPDSSITRREQAMMLAVNTVAFCAPRTTLPGIPGAQSVDLVRYVDTGVVQGGGGKSNRIYYGYAPQPFITEAVAFVDDQSNDLAFAVEYYNPNEPLVQGATDIHALNLNQFVISVHVQGAAGQLDFDPDSTTQNGIALGQLVPVPMDGGSIQSVTFKGGASLNDSIERLTTLPRARLRGVPAKAPAGSTIVFRLWRRGTTYVECVDEMAVLAPAPNTGDSEYYHQYRDLFDDDLYGRVGNQSRSRLAGRWAAVTDINPTDRDGHGITTGVTDMAEVVGNFAGFAVGPAAFGPGDGSGTPEHTAPVVPLYTMNPDIANLSEFQKIEVHGASRPGLFPTVGFMLHVPRFSHSVPLGGAKGTTPGTPIPMSLALKNEWDFVGAGRGYVAGTGHYPADFGHMPLFENRQATVDTQTTGYFADKPNRAGPLPWGLLVFDYFTTYDPYDDTNFDPMAIPGRININVAPWPVVAGLPVIGPSSNGDLLPNEFGPSGLRVSPAFWDYDAGVLVGKNGPALPPTDPNRLNLALLHYNPKDRWYRLGGSLALSAVAYRDRAQLVVPQNDPYPGSYDRNALGGKVQDAYRSMPTYGPARVENLLKNPADPAKVGFVSLGELLLVKGFDASGQFIYQGAQGSSGLSRTLHAYVETTTGATIYPDFMKAVSLMTLLDTHFLTTRSNTFTAYITVTDRENPQSSIRAQVTFDRGNTLPKLVLDENVPKTHPSFGKPKFGVDGQAIVAESSAQPEIVGQRQIGYFNAAYDD